MFNGFIKKTIYLPSGGIDYSPLVFVGKPDGAYAIMRLDPMGSDSNFDMLTSTVNHYCELPVPIKDMYTQDIYYIWSFLLTMDLMHGEDFKLKIPCSKSSCHYVNSVFLSVGTMDISILNKFNGDTLVERVFDSHLGISVGYKPRKGIANFDFGSAMTAHNDPHLEITLSYFCATQAEWIKYDGKLLPKHQWIQALMSLTYVELYRLYKDMIAYSKSFGIYDNFIFKCRTCGTENQGWLYDDLISSFYTSGASNNKLGQLENVFKFSIEEARLPSFTLDDVYAQPIRYAERFSAALKEIKFQHGQVMM